MPETAESHSYSLTTNRNCVIELTNLTTNICLCFPKVYMLSGFSYSPPQPTVRHDQTEVCSFTKDDNTASGAVGVLTYELCNLKKNSIREQMAVMFSVPYDYNFYKNWLALGIFDRSEACDKNLYKKMYESKDMTNFVRQEANGSGLLFSGQEVDLRACMSDEGRAIIKLEVYDRIQ